MGKGNKTSNELKEALKGEPLIIVGISGIEGEEICSLLSNVKKKYTSVHLDYDSPYWEEVPEDIKALVNDALNSGKEVVLFCIKGNVPEKALSIDTYHYDDENQPYSPLEQLDMALGKEVTPYHRLISANGRGFIVAMREEAAKILKGFGAKSRYNKIMDEAEVTEFEMEDFRQKFYDSGEAGMEIIPEPYRAGIGLVIKNIRKRDRAARGITIEQERQAERAVLKSYLIGSVTVVDMHDASPASVLDRLVETEKYGLLMLSDTRRSCFVGPWKKVKKFAEHFKDGKTGGEPPVRGYWKGKYSKPIIIDFVEGLEKVKEKKEPEKKSDFFMRL